MEMQMVDALAPVLVVVDHHAISLFDVEILRHLQTLYTNKLNVFSSKFLRFSNDYS